MARPNYIDTLARIHALKPRTYLEIGVRYGHSLGQVGPNTAVLGIDPAFEMVEPIELSKIKLARQTSDDYFANANPQEWLGGPIELAFIDGMHLIEFALRDFINVEKHCTKDSVIVFDDVLPQERAWADREKHTTLWTGDIFKIIAILAEYRPDLELNLLDTSPTGLLLVTNLDSNSTVLADYYDEIVKRFATPDPQQQQVPTAIIARELAQNANQFLGSGALKRFSNSNETGSDFALLPEFDAAFYRASYPDLAGMGEYELELHYENHGKAEGRVGALPADFDPKYYQERYADVSELNTLELVQHYLNNGKAEGRIGKRH